MVLAELNAIERHETFVAGRYDFLALLQSAEHLDAFRIAAAKAHRAALGEVFRRINHEYPLPTRVVEERAVRNHERVRGLADLQPHPHGLTPPDRCGRIARKQ